jgi:hypothetical protein
MKIKKLEIEDYIKLKQFLKEIIPYSDNILMDLPNNVPILETDIVLRVYIVDSNLQNRINFVINNDCSNNYMKIVDNNIEIELIEKIKDYIRLNLIAKINIII